MRVHRQAVVRVLSDPMVVLPSLAIGIDVDGDTAEMREMVKQLVPHFFPHVMTLCDRETAGHRDTHFRMESVSDPPRAHIADALD